MGRRRAFFAVAIAVFVVASLVIVLYRVQAARQGAFGTAEDRPSSASEALSIEAQEEAFRRFLTVEIQTVIDDEGLTYSADEVRFDLVLIDDLDGNGLFDFFVQHVNAVFCGSAGCPLDVYLGHAIGEYELILGLIGTDTPPRARPHEGSAYKDVVVGSGFAVDGEPLYQVFSWLDGMYREESVRYCNGIEFDNCRPDIVTWLDSQAASSLHVNPDAVYRTAPDLLAPPVSKMAPPGPGYVVGSVVGKDFYLVDFWKGASAFVADSDISR